MGSGEQACGQAVGDTQRDEGQAELDNEAQFGKPDPAGHGRSLDEDAI